MNAALGEEAEAPWLGEAGKEDRSLTGAAADANQSSHLNEGGKKDPLTRQRELLVDSGLAEVSASFIHALIAVFPSQFHAYCSCILSRLKALWKLNK